MPRKKVPELLPGYKPRKKKLEACDDAEHRRLCTAVMLWLLEMALTPSVEPGVMKDLMAEARQWRKMIADTDKHVGKAPLAEYEAVLAKLEARAKEVSGARVTSVPVPARRPGTESVP